MSEVEQTGQAGQAGPGERAGAGAAEPVVVVGVDGSESSVLALRWGAHLAAASGARTLVVGVWEAYSAFGLVGEGWSALPPDWDPEKIVHTEVRHVVAHVYGNDLPPGVEVRFEQGNVARVLLDLSADAVALVVGSRGQGGFASLLLGSVSAACAAHATCPVLVVHGDRPPPTAPSVAGREAGSGG
ncbi:universal stress protein [Pedococcus sp. KACC 23699]|uniref:Universal stress protein n=1 Tax=Pedococcus sp. KACC 23699 TaxID=3149228 RepID=A0AAU7JSK8_9MICO